jgi:wobble nucleotide-excising tRNase
MLSKINHLTNFGNYRQFQWGSTTPFSKRNLIYGWNYSGKTTLSRLFQILAEPNELLQWPGCQFEIELQDGALISQASLANTLRIKVFNRDFIRQNFQQEHKAPAVFIVGGNTIHLRNRIARLIEHENRVQAIKARLVENHRRLQSELDSLGTNHARNIATLTGDKTYNRTKLVADIDRVKAKPEIFVLAEEDIQAKVSLIRSTDQWAAIQPVSALATDLDSLRQNLLLVLQKTAPNEAITKLKDNRALESWIRTGLEHHTTASHCEFCESLIPEERLASLRRHFSKAYEDLTSEVASEIAGLEKIELVIKLPNQLELMPDLRARFVSLKEQVEDWIAWADSVTVDLSLLIKQKQHSLESLLVCDVDTSRSSEAGQLVAQINSIISLHNQKRAQIDTEKTAAKDAIEKHQAACFYLDNNILDRETAICAALDQIEKTEITLANISGKRATIETLIQQQSIAAHRINETVCFLLPDNNISVVEVLGGSFEFRRDGAPAYNLSDGEKTAITFAYFLATLENNGASLAQTVVFIDDPISSLDSNHIYAIYALIINRLNPTLQIFVSTHNGELYTLLKDRWFKSDRQYANRSDACAYYTRRYLDGASNQWHSTLEDAPSLLRKYKSEYQFVFDQLHQFSSSQNPTLHEAYTSPNLLRKFLEAYLGFRKPCIPSWSAKLDLLFDTDAERVEIQKFADDASHLQVLSRALQQPSFISSSQNTVRKVIQALKVKDYSHYESMCTVIGVTP